jgi:hypothetical protein
MVDTILDDRRWHRISIGGDLNAELERNSPFDPQGDSLSKHCPDVESQ